MKKRVLSILLALTMLVSLLPVSASVEAAPAVTASDKAGSHTDAHKCEECGEAFSEWTSNNSLPAAGHYYLTKDVTLTAERQVTGELHLCLNGYVIKAASGKRIFNTKGDTATELVITDCTAYTDAAGVYHAGALTGGQDKSAGGGVVFVRRMGVAKIYEGRLTGNSSTIAGGVVALQAKSGSLAGGKFYMYGGEMSNNTAIGTDGVYKKGGAVYTGSGTVVELENVTIRGNTGVAGGAIYTGATATPIKLTNCLLEGNVANGADGGGVLFAESSARVEMTGCTLKGNQADSGDAGVKTAGGVAFLKGTAKLTLTGCTLEENKAPYGGGAVIWAKEETKLDMTNCTVRNNQAKNAGGVIYAMDKLQLTVTGSTFTGNTCGSAGSVLYYQNYVQVSLKDTTITENVGNSTSSSGYGAAVYGLGGSSKLTIGGKMVIANNTIKSPNTADLNFNNATTDILYINELEEGSRVNFSTKASTDVKASDVVALGGAQTTPWNDEWVTFLDENGNMKQVGYENNEFVFVVAHKHSGCNDASCTEHGEVAYKAWKDGTSLPASGSWYLDTDVNVSKEVRLGGTLNLCLNGHTVTGQTASARIYSTTADAQHVLNISDCTAKTVDGIYTAGSITGSHNTNTGAGGGAIFLRKGGVLRLFDGIISNNASVAGGGAIYANEATIEMYNGLLTGNKAQNAEGTWKSGGAIYLQSSHMTMYGGEISGNEANDGAGILLSGTSALDMKGGKITGNTAHKTGAGVNVATTTSKITLSGDVQISSNTLADGTANNLRLVDGTVMELGTVDSKTRVGVTATAFKPVSGQTADYTANFRSDDIRLSVVYRDGALFMDTSDHHKHCLCGGDAAQGCDHTAIVFAPWTDATSLPASGNWYLDTDVTVSQETRLAGTLNLCLNGYTVTGQTASARIYSTTADAQHVLNISDCTAKTVDGIYTAGSITGSHNTNTGAGGGAIFLRKGGVLRLFDGIISNNASVAGGGAIYANEATIEMYNGLLTGNKAQNAEGAWKSGGAIYLQSSHMTMYGGEISGNEANDGAGILLSGTSALDMKGGKISGNTAHKTGAGVNVATTTSKITLSGDVQISGNTLADGTANNLRLVDGTVMELGKLSETATVGITASAFRYISNETTDCTACVISDSPDETVIYQDGKLYVDANTDHKHCLCSSDDKNCDHGKLNFAPWSDPEKLPSFGNYYLTVDVTVASRTNLENAELNLCLNGHSITVGQQGGRVYRMYSGAHLSLTDCTDKPGKITGATQGAILSDQDGKDMIINIWHITFTGNHAKSAGGAIIAQGDTTVNLYSGKIANNSSVGYLKLDENGKPVLNEKGEETYVSCYGGGILIIGGTFHMYGGEISGNKTEAVSYTKADGTKANGGGFGGGLYVRGTANLYGGIIQNNQAHAGGGVYVTGETSVVNLLGTEISGNSAVSGGGMILQGKADAAMTDGVISGNQATDSGAGVYVSAGSVLELKGGKIDSNKAGKNGGGVAISGKEARVIVDGCQISSNHAKNAGGIYSQTYAVVELKSGKVRNNYASASGGGIYNATNATFIMSGGSVDGNTTDGDVGGVMCLRGKAEITGGTISNNRGANTGGLKIYGTNANISNLSIVGNRAIGKPTVNEVSGKTTYTGGSGCGLMVSATSYTKDGVKTDYIPVVNINSIYVADNHANGSAAGILVQSKGVVFNLQNATITNNEAASGAGGGMYIASNVKATLKNVTVTNNKANTAGGINFYGCTVDVDGLCMHDNISVKSGGGMTVVAKTALVNVRNAEIYNNTAGGAGGGLVVQTSATMHMEDSKIYGNITTSLGGGIYFSAPSTGSLKNVEIFENRAQRDGGGMNIYANCVVTLENVTVRNNESATVGGGIYTRGRLEAVNCNIRNNKAVDGGGIYTFKVAGDVVRDAAGAFVENTVISGNEALNQGGGVYNHRGGPIYLSGCMITDNMAAQQGSAVYADGRLGLDNVTITGNTSANDSYAVYVTSAEYDGHTYFTGHKKLSGEVIVKDNAGGDMFLQEGAIVTVTGEQLGEKTHVTVTIPSGVLRQYVQGVYGYEGDDLHYVITAGSRSLTDPETLPVQPEQTEPAETTATEATAPMEESEDSTILYAGIVGIGAVLVLAAVILIIVKKKRTTKE